MRGRRRKERAGRGGGEEEIERETGRGEDWRRDVEEEREEPIREGGIFHAVKNVVVSQVGDKEGKHIKLLVEVDITKPLLRGTMDRLEGELRWPNFTYERLPDFCYQCGIIGHFEKSCVQRSTRTSHSDRPQYGSWLKANMGSKLLDAAGGTLTNLIEGSKKAADSEGNGTNTGNDKEPTIVTANILWNLWKDRNREVFDKQSISFDRTLGTVLDEWWELRITNQEMHSRKSAYSDTSFQGTDSFPVHEASIAINCARAIHMAKRRADFGMMGMDSNGNILKVWADSKECGTDLSLIEAEAIRFSLIKARLEGWDRINILSSNIRLVQKITKRYADDAKLSIVLEDIFYLMNLFS
ncbi:hypothetical protein ACH5RR_021390 [Cinchona calisaya]|uniref:CCHC-type domain-containing protein n=1 Tax=Cinchona calisaya TaxID=153742 RepID=A0ABD2ZIY3_9GENT